jgi:hypothetical protein
MRAEQYNQTASTGKVTEERERNLTSRYNMEHGNNMKTSWG